VGASLQPDIHSGFRPSTRSVYLAVLDKTEPSPFAPESDEEKAAEEKKAEENKPGDKPEDKPAAKPGEKSAGKPADKPAVKVDFDGLLQRILAVPLPPGNYSGLQTGKPGTLLAVEAPSVADRQAGPAGSTVHRFDMKARRSDVVSGGVSFFLMARNGEKFLVRRQDRWFIEALKPLPPPGAPAAPPAAGGGQPLATDRIQVRVDPRSEWRQMYRDAWRIEREFFYDPDMHGYDLAAAEKRYEPYLEGIVSRRDLNYLFAEMLGGIEVGHLSVGGGDLPETARVPNGLLGADYETANGRYRFVRVYDGENWNPRLQAPLTQPGVNVRAGEYLLAVDGRELTAAENVYSFFENTSGKRVLIKIGPTRDGHPRGRRKLPEAFRLD
jgi:tricorn protease